MKNRRKRRGFALMLVILEMVLIAGLWGIAHRQLMTTMRFVVYQQANATMNATQGVEVHKPLARALGLLETGDPPDGGSGVYTCNLTLLTGTGPAYFKITYLKQETGSGSTDETWTVTSTQQAVDASDQTAWNSNLMPSTFGN